MTKGAIYVYFETKEKLFEEMVRFYSLGILADADAVLAATEGSCTTKLRAFLSFVCDRCAHDRIGREVLRFVVADGARFTSIVDYYYRNVIEPALILIDELIKIGINNGEFSFTVGQVGARILIAPIFSLAVLKLSFASKLQIDESAYLSIHTDAMLKGLRSRST